MLQYFKSTVMVTGLAMFCMFFGAGNIVFPLALGQLAQDKNIFAILGLLITAVGVPFLGLLSISLFDGDYEAFFRRIGRIPGFLMILAIIGLIGPFGAIPRCIALSFSTMALYFPYISLPWFSAISCLLIFVFSLKQKGIVDLLGYFFTPVLLLSLVIIIVKGFIESPAAPETEHENLTIFLHGLKEGYHTMDLLGAFFFSSVVLVCLKQDFNTADKADHKRMILTIAKASCIGAFLLAAIYIGFSYVAAFNSESLMAIGKDQLLGTVAMNVLGPYAGIVACVAVIFACLTTAIALAAVSAEFIHMDLCQDKYINYPVALVVTVVISYLISILDFNGISRMLAPILIISYPALIVLSIVNLFYKLFDFKMVKIPFYITLGISVVYYYLDYIQEFIAG